MVHGVPSEDHYQPAEQGHRKKQSRKMGSLTRAEARILVLLPTHRTLTAIAAELGVDRPTVKTHVENIYKKLGATNRAQAVTLADSPGLLPRP